MLPDDVAVAARRSNVESLADLKAEARRVEHRPAANHAMTRQSAQLPRHVCHDVNWAGTARTTQSHGRQRKRKWSIMGGNGEEKTKLWAEMEKITPNYGWQRR